MTDLPHQGARTSVLSSALVLTAVLAATLVAWAVAVQQMRGMDAGPGTDLGSFGWFVGIWLTMTIAMMLPSAAPTTLMFSRLGRPAQTTLFVAGYLLAWLTFGVTAYLVGRMARAGAPSFVGWDQRGPWVAGAALAAAGVYQLSEELVADELVIEDGPLAVSFRGNCGYGATFEYAG